MWPMRSHCPYGAMDAVPFLERCRLANRYSIPMGSNDVLRSPSVSSVLRRKVLRFNARLIRAIAGLGVELLAIGT